MAPLADATMGRWFTPAFDGAELFRQTFLAAPPEGYAAATLTDARGGYGTPTVLVDGRDLFGMPEPVVPHDPPT